MDKKNNHYVPQFYIKYFSNNGRSVGMWIHGKEPIPTASIKQILCEEFLYGKDGQLENILANKEGEWSQIINKIMEDHKIPEDLNEYKKLLSFVLISSARTLLDAKCVKEHFYELAKTICKMKWNITLSQEEFDDLYSKESMLIPNLYSICSAEEDISFIFDLKAILIINKSNRSFITSDYPTAKYNQFFISRKYYLYNNGLAHSGLQMYLPLSPYLCLCLYDKDVYTIIGLKDNVLDIESGSQIDELNKLFILNSYDYVIYNEDINQVFLNKYIKQYKPVMKTSQVQSFENNDGDMSLVFSKPSVKENIKIQFFIVNKKYAFMKMPEHFGDLRRPSAENELKKYQRNLIT